MRGKDYSTGLRGVLFERQHYERMGAALWLYGWLVLRQTHERNGTGYVLGGAPVSYREIEEETGFNPRTLERWMRTLRRHGYVETEAAPGGVIVRITKAKKFAASTHSPRKDAGGVRRNAGGAAQNCVASGSETFMNQGVAGRIGSSSVGRFIEEPKDTEIHRDFHSPREILGKIQRHMQNPSGLGENQNAKSNSRNEARSREHLDACKERKKFFFEARRQQQLLRAEREEALRRELAIGTGPEVRRS